MTASMQARDSTVHLQGARQLHSKPQQQSHIPRLCSNGEDGLPKSLDVHETAMVLADRYWHGRGDEYTTGGQTGCPDQLLRVLYCL